MMQGLWAAKSLMSRLRRDENGDGWTYILVIVGVLILTGVILIAFSGPARTTITGFLSSMLSYINNVGSTVQSSATVTA